MVDKNIRLKTKKQDGTYDYLYPASKSSIIDVKGKNLDTVLAETNEKITENNETFTSQLAQTDENKIDKNRGAVTSADLSQEVKEQMTGESVAVVGKNSVLKENIVDGQVSYGKMEDYIRERLADVEKTLGSSSKKIGQKSLVLSEYSDLTSAGYPLEIYLEKPATETGLLTIAFISGGESQSNFLIGEKIGEITGPGAFKVLKKIPFSTTSDDLRKTITLKTDVVIEKGQFLGIENSNRFYWERDGVNEGIYERLSGGDYRVVTTRSPLVMGEIGGRINEIEEIKSKIDGLLSGENITVKNFGAAGDGITNDTKSLQNAMAALGGGEVVIPKGDYLVTETIEIPTNTIVRGEGVSTRIILGDGYKLTNYSVRLGGSSILANEPGAKNVVVKDLAIEGNINEPLLGTRLIGLGFIGLTNGIAENIHINNINFFPTLMTSDSSPTGYNFAAVRSENIEVRGGVFTNGGYECLGIYDDCENVIVDGVYTGSAWRTSLQIHRGCKNVKVINSTINQQSAWADAGLTTHGEVGQELKNILIANNSIYATAREEYQHQYNGTVQIMDGGIAEGYRIVNNHIRGQRTGIYMMGSINNVVSGNDIECDTGFGIYVPENCTDSIISNNIVAAPSNPMHSKNILVINNVGLEDQLINA